MAEDAQLSQLRTSGFHPRTHFPLWPVPRCGRYSSGRGLVTAGLGADLPPTTLLKQVGTQDNLRVLKALPAAVLLPSGRHRSRAPGKAQGRASTCCGDHKKSTGSAVPMQLSERSSLSFSLGSTRHRHQTHNFRRKYANPSAAQVLTASRWLLASHAIPFTDPLCCRSAASRIRPRSQTHTAPQDPLQIFGARPRHRESSHASWQGSAHRNSTTPRSHPA